MSTIRDKPARGTRQKPETVRKEALAIARDLLITGGPRAITLQAIGRRMGMTHANLIHHFGSAEAFRARLRDAMVEDITRKAAVLVADQAGAVRSGAIVDQVFEAYASGGIGMLMAWSALTGGHDQADSIRKTTGELVAVIERALEGPNAAGVARQMVSLATLLAFADSVIGSTVAETVGVERDAMRLLTARVLDDLAKA